MTTFTFTATPYHLSLASDHPEKVKAQEALHGWLKATDARSFTHLPDDFGFTVEVGDPPRPTPDRIIGRHYRVEIAQ